MLRDIKRYGDGNGVTFEDLDTIVRLAHVAAVEQGDLFMDQHAPDLSPQRLDRILRAIRLELLEKKKEAAKND